MYFDASKCSDSKKNCKLSTEYEGEKAPVSIVNSFRLFGTLELSVNLLLSLIFEN